MKQFRSLISTVGLSLLIVTSFGIAQARSAYTGHVSAPDRQFMHEAAQGGLMEVELGRLAARRGADRSVRQFGERMVRDHSKANAELKALAARKHVALPSGLKPEHQAMKNHLSRLSGSAFDRMYMRHMVEDHVEDVAAFRTESRRAQDRDLRRWATKTLPTLQSHLRMARDVSRRVGAGGRRGRM